MNLTLLSDIAKTALGLFLLLVAIKFLFSNLWLIPAMCLVAILLVAVCLVLYASHRLGEIVLDNFAKVANKMFGTKE